MRRICAQAIPRVPGFGSGALPRRIWPLVMPPTRDYASGKRDFRIDELLGREFMTRQTPIISADGAKRHGTFFSGRSTPWTADKKDAKYK
jgi:hypothetical protein